MTTFNKLREINVNEHTEKKKDLTYLSWAWAWDIFKQNCPDATYKIHRFDGKPYLFDESTGYMVFTEVTANGETHEMWLPVMDGANNAMKDRPYKYTVMGRHPTERGKKVRVEKSVDAATMFDINKTIMRCLTKNLAMFGLGLYIYAGEDLPDINDNDPEPRQEENDANKKEPKVAPQKAPKQAAQPREKKPIPDEEYETLRQAIAEAVNMDALKKAFMVANKKAVEYGDKPAQEGFIKVKDIRKTELENAQEA